jgi:hypothetical protein
MYALGEIWASRFIAAINQRQLPATLCHDSLQLLVIDGQPSLFSYQLQLPSTPRRARLGSARHGTARHATPHIGEVSKRARMWHPAIPSCPSYQV